jgi:tetratricopeptide (TPR) repeat protein
MVVRVIDARARLGRLQAAEIARAEYLDRVGPEGPREEVEEAIGRVRAAFGRTPADRAQDRVPFVGRQTCLTQLEGMVRRVRDGFCSYALITGEAGIGKTRLLEQVARSAALDGIRCLRASPVELERRISLNPIIDALRGIDVDRHLTEIGEPWRTVVGATLPRDSLRGPVEAPPPIENDALSRRLLDAFSILLESVSQERPTILFIDDLHWADDTTIAALHFFRRRRDRVAFGLVATARPDLVRPSDALSVMLSDDTSVSLERVDLALLEEQDGRDILGHMGEQRLSWDATEKLLALSGLHPLYLTELARDFLAGRLELPASRSEALTLPISLRQILTSRTETLSTTATKVAQVLSVGSRPMGISHLGNLLDRPFDELVDAVDELRHGGLAQLERDRVWIAHDLFKSAIYSGMSDTRRALLHARHAELIARSGGADQSGELALHYDRAGETSLAAANGWIAGERAMVQGAIAEAAYFFELVTRNEHDPHTIAEATANYALAHHLGRKIRRANPALELAASRLREVGNPRRARRMDILRVEGLADDGDTPVDELMARLSKIKAEASGAEDWEAVALALDVELRLVLLDERVEAARDVLTQCAAITRKQGGSAAAIAHQALAIGLLLDEPKAAMQSATEAVRLTDLTAPDRRLRVINRLLIVFLHQARILGPEAQALIAEARTLSRQSGDLQERFSLEANLGVALMDVGLRDIAADHFDAAEALLGESDMPFARINLACNRGEMALEEHDYEEARRWFNSVASHQGQAIPRYTANMASAGLGLCALETGGLTEARRHEADLDMGSQAWFYDPSLILTFQARLHERRGRLDLASRLLSEGSENLFGRLIPAWLKLQLPLARVLIKAGDAGAMAVADRAFSIARAHQLDVRAAQFADLSHRARRL